MIHVIDKMDTKSGVQTNGPMRNGRSGSAPRSRSPQPSQLQSLSNGIENLLPEANLVPNDRSQKVSVDNSTVAVVEQEIGLRVLPDGNNDVSEEASALFDDSDITPPSPLLSNAFASSSHLPSNSAYLNNSKPQVSYALPYKFNEMKLKQEVSETRANTKNKLNQFNH